MTSKPYLEIARDWNNFPIFDATTATCTCQDDDQTSWYQFLLPQDSRPFGFMLPWVVHKMPWTSDFVISHEKPPTVQLLDSSDGKNTAVACNTALEQLIARVVEQRTFKGFDRVSSECFRIIGSQPPIYINRTASTIFGIAVQGVHMVVYTRTEDHMKIWVPRRAPTLFSYPGLLDSAVGGGIKAELSPLQAVLQEADEEASLPEKYLKKHMRSCGALTFMSCTDDRTGYEKGFMVPEVAYVYELEVPSDMALKPNDGEVEKYILMDLDQVAESVKTSQFKPSSAAVMVDFFIRHGIITDENEANYLSLVGHNHRHLPTAVTRLSGER